MLLRCPICKTEMEVPSDYETRPFCSPRCKKLDLGNWLEGNYRLPRELSPEDLMDLSPEEQEALLTASLSERDKLN